MSQYALEDAASDISTVIYDWLEAGVEISSQPDDPNFYLNDYYRAIRGLRGGFEHPDNFAWGKLNGHMNRLGIWYGTFAEVSPDSKDFDTLAARVTFAGLMQIDGSYRDQCYVEARGAEDYTARRQNVIGVNITNTIMDKLLERLPESGDFAEANVDVGELGRQRERASELGEKAVKTLCTRVILYEKGLSAENDLGVEGSESAKKMMEAQRLWLGFTVDSIILAAKLKRGDLGAVPFREPTSDGNQSGCLYYPLREPVNWSKVMGTNLRPI